MTLDPNSENYKNWKSNGPFVQVRNEDGDANASFRVSTIIRYNPTANAGIIYQIYVYRH